MRLSVCDTIMHCENAAHERPACQCDNVSGITAFALARNTGGAAFRSFFLKLPQATSRGGFSLTFVSTMVSKLKSHFQQRQT